MNIECYSCLLTDHHSEKWEIQGLLTNHDYAFRTQHIYVEGGTLPRRHSVPLEPECYEWWRNQNYSRYEHGREIKMSISCESKINSQAWIIAFIFKTEEMVKRVLGKKKKEKTAKCIKQTVKLKVNRAQGNLNAIYLFFCPFYFSDRSITCINKK